MANEPRTTVKPDGTTARLRAFNRIAWVIAVIAQMLMWIAAATTAAIGVILIVAAAKPDGPFTVSADGDAVQTGFDGSDFHLSIHPTVLDTTFNAVQSERSIEWLNLALALTAAIAIYTLFALTLREVAGMCRDLSGWAENRPEGTPFIASITQRLRRAGWFMIAAPLATFILGATAILVTDRGASVSVGSNAICVMVGFILLTLAHAFDYGFQLQTEVDGLL
ncbi:hypothetical protein [Bifidobacterium eulemuris]|uniref:DUF2975 domain-containing protein n=1 Tax=Bifidobacterium eulemuris TaxID=1765219 RepID=A0A261GC00_9BIFI|nr:hypothetical protein [Bifidobacterium eulemuris]OZG68959.1 hypothetical protein BEUL_0365 [Bifidobacterium eulemuris]QOL31506.1 hypothetical protein BE0216_02810 [Bifidobacterium eulemuris]